MADTQLVVIAFFNRFGFTGAPGSQPGPGSIPASAQLLEPLGGESVILAFLAKNPRGGQHHVCFEVADIEEARDEMRAKGAALVGTGEPRIGAHGVPVIFVHPKDMGGVLVELMQTPPQAHS